MPQLGDHVVIREDFSFRRSCQSTNHLIWSKSLVLPGIIWYNSFEHRYLKRLITFSHDRRGNIANLSRIDPALLGVKDTNSFAKNVLYLHGNTSDPVLCFSLVLVMSDNHDEGRSLGSEKEWVLKDIAGVLHVMELERFVAVLGLAYDLPYLPDDSARRETDLLHFSMVENSFCFTTSMTHNTGEYSLNIVYYANTYI